MAHCKKKCRQYSMDYLKFGFIPSPHNPQMPLCLICHNTFSNEAMKPSRLSDHITKRHPASSSSNLDYFKRLKEKYEKRTTITSMVKKTTAQTDDGLIASYNISRLIAQCAKSHTIGETLILPAIKEVCQTVLHQSTDFLKVIPLSNDSVRRRIDEMGADIEEQLCDILQKTEFAIQLDESTLQGNEALLMAYVRFIHNGEAREEMLFARTLETDTKGESIFNILQDFCAEKEIPMKNIIACATDGAPAMIGCHKGFISYLKKVVPGVFAIHCIIHRQHLAAKELSPKLHKSLKVIIQAINKIKASSLNDRLFRKLCHEKEEDFERLLLHTEVRWLSKGNCLNRIFHLFDTVVEFLEEVAPDLATELMSCHLDCAYLADIFEKINELNRQLQGSNTNLVASKSLVMAFMSKLILYKNNISRAEYAQFASLKSLTKEVTDNDLQVYTSHLEKLHGNFMRRFQDLCKLEIPDWVMNPFEANPELVDVEIQETVIDLQNDEQMKNKFRAQGFAQMWLHATERYPELFKRARIFLVAFPTSYLVEKGFSCVVLLHTKQRNRLDISKRGDLRMFLTGFTPDVKKLALSHQAQGSH